MALALHLALCSACRAYRAQLELIRAALRDWGHRVEEFGHKPDVTLPADARTRIAAALRKQA